MTATINDPLIGPTRGTTAEAIGYARSRGAKRLPDVETYLAELWRLCAITHLDATLLFAQAADETDTFKSDYWVQYANPAGLGALETLDDPGNIDYVGGTFTAATAAQAQVVHAYLYAVGPVPAGHPLAPFVPLDPRYDAVIAAGYAGRATSLAYLSGRWAANPNYARQIVAHANLAFRMAISYTTEQEGTMPTTQSTNTVNLDVPAAGFAPKQFNLATDYAQFGLSFWQATYLLGQCEPRQAEIEGLIFHSQYGYIQGSLSHWLSVQASATAMVRRDGAVLWITPEGKRQWTTGDVQGPTERAKVLYRGGVGPDHRAVAFEFEGLRGQAFTREQIQTATWLYRRFAAKYPKIRPDEYHIAGHATFNDSAEKSECPGQANLDRIRQAIADDVAAGGRVVTAPAEQAAVSPQVVERKELAFLAAIPQSMVGFGYGAEDVGESRFYPFPRRWTVTTETPVYQYGTRGSAKITDGSGNVVSVKPGGGIDGAYIFQSPQDGDWWLVSTTSGRVPLSAVENPFDFLRAKEEAA